MSPRGRHPYVPLTRRVNGIILVSLIIGLGLMSAYFGQSLFVTLEETTTENLLQQSRFLYQAIEDFMLPGEAPLAEDFFQGIQELDEDYTIRLYRPDGTTAFSDISTIKAVNQRIGASVFPLPDTRQQEYPLTSEQDFQHALGPPPAIRLFQEERRGRSYQRIYKPLLNLPNCTGCHGAAHTVRGVLDMQIDITDIRNKQYTNLAISAGLFVGLLILLILVITRALNRRVLKPVQVIGRVCQEVTEGNFSYRANISNNDEMGDLAERVNTMITGLHERFKLTKYVSSSTINALSGDEEGRKERVSLFFSDIRGFTAFSESRDPKEVVEVLNGILGMQTEIIHHYQGDIDKYVGDEVVALFSGERSGLRAARAALEIQKRLQDGGGYQGLHVGIGINTGEVILGRMGSDIRADYTVIGDEVNTAARLCSAAGPDEIFITASTTECLQGRAETKGPFPLKLKGKTGRISAWKLLGLRRGKETL